MDNKFCLDFISKLNQSKSQKQLNSDIKQLEKIINMIRLTGTFAKGNTKKELNSYVKQLSGQLSTIKLKGKFDSRNLKAEADKALSSISFKDIDMLNIDENKAKLKVKKVIADVKTYAERTPITINIESKRNKLNNDLTTYLNRNTKINESSVLLKEADKVRELIDAVDDRKSLREATDAFQLYKSEVSATGFNTKSTTDKIKGMFSQVTKIGSALGLTSLAINRFSQSLNALKENDTTLTEISKTSEMTKKQLKELGDEAFKVASKYGQLSGNYLLGVQEMARSGYESLSKELGELSLLAQSAGNMTAEMANNYILATDAAYKYEGSVESLNAALDGANYISNKNSASLTDIADATRVSASFAANAGVAIDELTAAEATMIATTKRSGSEIGRAFRSIVLNLQQVSGEFDGEVIDEEQLKKVEARCHSLGVELEYMKDGVATLRNPIEVLKELSEVYNSLPDNSADKQGLISDLGGKYHANALSALLSRWDMYEKMVGEFSQGTGSALEEAEKTADSWEGRLNSLSNSFDSFVNTLTNKGAVLNGISFFDRLIQGAEALTDTIGAIPVALTTLNTALTTVNKNYGITQILNPETNKIDIQGNMFGIDFTAIKNQKKHFLDAEAAISVWNDELVSGKANIETFNSEVVKNNAQLKAYIATTSKEAPASLSGYKSYLNAAGVSTDALRLKTVLLNSAITMGLSLGIQAVVSVIHSCVTASDRLLESASELGSQFSSTQSDIESYKTKIEDLYKIINDNTSSYKDTYNARKELLSIQDEMIQKFGSEAEAVKLVTDAIDGQTEALDTLTEREWQETKNAFISSSGKSWTKYIGDAWANLWSDSTDNFDRMKKEMEDTEVTFFIDPQFENYEEFREKLEKIFGVEMGKQGFVARDFEDVIGVPKGERFILSGDLDDIYDKMINIQSLAENMGIDDKFLKDLSDQAGKINDRLEGYNEFYNQSVLYDKINNNDAYKESFDEINKAYKKFQNIFATGDEEAIAKAKQSYAEVVQSAIEGIDDQSVIDYFNNMYPELQEAVGTWEFEVKFKAAVDDDSDDFENEVKNAADSFNTSEDILNFDAENATDEQIDDYTELQLIADKYKLTLEQLIEKMIKMGLVASQTKQDLLNKLLPDKGTAGVGNLFHNAISSAKEAVVTDWVNSLSEEDAVTANSKEFEEALNRQKEGLNGAALSVENYNAALEETKSKQGDIADKLPLTFLEALADLDTDVQQKLLDLAKSGEITSEVLVSTEEYAELLSQTGLSAESAKNQILDMLSVQEKLSGAANGLDKLKSSYEEFKELGFVTAQSLESLPDAFKELKGYDLFSEIVGDPTQGKEKIQQAFNDIVTEYIISQDTLSGLVNASEAEIQSYIANLKQMGITNAEEVINTAIQVMNQENELLNAAEKEYMNYLNAKEGYDEEYLKSATSKNSQLLSALGKTYKSDYDNWCDLMKQKAQVYNKFINAIKNSINYSSGSPLSETGWADKVLKDTANGTKNIYDDSFNPSNPYTLPRQAKEGWWSQTQVKQAREVKQKERELQQLKDQLKFDVSTIPTDYSIDYSPKGSNKDGSDSKKKETEKEFSEIFDWIERRIKKFQKSFDKWIKQAETAVTSGFINKYYKKAISAAQKQLSTYSKAYNRYMAQANAVGLEETYASKVRNGTLDIEEIYAKGTEEDIKQYEELAEKIKTYQEWWDKAQDSMDSFMETAEKLYNLPLDKAARKIEIFSDSIDLLDKKLDNAIGSKNKNKLIDKQTKQEKNTLKAYKTAQTESQTNLKNAKKTLKKNNNLDTDDGITAKEKKKILAAMKANKEIDLSFFNENSAGYKEAVKYNEALKANKQAIYDARSAQEDYNRYLVESAKQKFDNIADDYNKKLQKLDWKKSKYDNKMAEIEASGKKVGISYYNTQKNINDQTLKNLTDEKAALLDNLKYIKKGTDEWYDAKDQIQEVNNQISDCVQTTYELNNAINQLHFDLFDDISDGIKRVITEQEFLRGLFTHEKNVDTKTGNFTDAGLANLGSLSASYYAAQENAEKDSAMLKDLQNVKKNGKQKDGSYKLGDWEFNSLDDLEAKIDEVYTKWQDDIKETYSLESSIVDAMKEKYQAELDMLKELIDKKKEALNAEKDLHDYQKSISEKTDNITKIQAQIAAYSGDTSQEGMAKLQKLQKELNEAQDDLKETEYSRYLSDSESMLDKLYDEYNKKLEEKLEDFMMLVQEGLNTANGNMAIIASFVEKVAKDNGYDIQTDGFFNSSSGKDIEGNSEKAAKDVEKDKKNQSGTKENKKLENNIKLSNTKDYIKENAKKADKKRSEYSAVNKAIYDMTDGKVLTDKQLERLAKIVGIDYNGSSKKSNLYKGLVEFGYIKPDDKEEQKVTTAPIALPSSVDGIKSYIKEHADKAKKDKKEYSDVNQKIYENKAKSYKGTGKVLSGKELKGLAKNLGVEYDNGSKKGALYKKLKEIKFPGFRKGGVVSVDDIEKQVHENGDTSLVSAQDGEGFVEKEHVEPVKELIKSVPDINKLTKVLSDTPIPLLDIPPKEYRDNVIRTADGVELIPVSQEDLLKSFSTKNISTEAINEAIKNLTPDFNSIIRPNLPDIQPVRYNNTTNIDMGGITMNGVNDPKEFSKQLTYAIKNDQKVQKSIHAVETDRLAGKSNALSINSIR